MELHLRDKAVFVAGGSKGIGFACAELFEANGAKVAIVSRSQQNVDAACGRLANAFGIAANLSDADEALRAVDTAEREIGPIDVLINAAGAAVRTLPDDLTPHAWRAAMDAKFFSYINVVDPVVKRMAARQTGVVINIIGNGGKVPSPTHIAGGAANAALMLATSGLAAAYAGRGVRVVGINPGRVETERVARAIKVEAQLMGVDENDMRHKSLRAIPMGRFASPNDIAHVALFIASECASYLTGVNITMDGLQDPMVL